jgi:hypothetical protein
VLHVRVLGLTVLAVLVLCAPAEAKVACGDGTTAFVDGKLRIFGIHYRTADEQGFEEYACLGRRMKPLYVGGVGSDTGVGFAETEVYAHAGRFLASYDFSDGEGGPDADVSVMDLRRRRSVVFMNLACCEGVPPLRVAPDGTAVVLGPGDGVLVKSPGQRRARALSGENARDLAMHGGTVYWTEAGQARSATLAGIRGGEATALEPVRLRRRGGACTAARGRTIAATGSVRVFVRDGRRVACRIGVDGRFRVGGDRPPRIVGDRWLLVRDGDRARVFDSSTGGAVAGARRVAQATLLADGTLAWIDVGGAVHVATPGGTPLVVGEGASRLAAARRAVYWTDATGPRRFPGVRPPAR